MRLRKAYPENPCTLVLGSVNIGLILGITGTLYFTKSELRQKVNIKAVEILDKMGKSMYSKPKKDKPIRNIKIIQPSKVKPGAKA